TDNAYHVVTGSVNSTAVLDGVTVTAGNANGSGSLRGGGGPFPAGRRPTINQVSFTGNHAALGAAIVDLSSSPAITNSSFTSNVATSGGGAIYNSGGSPTLNNDSFTSNTAPIGGAIYDNFSSSHITSGSFTSNTASGNGGAIY